MAPPSEIKSIPVVFSSTGIGLKAVPDQLAVTSFKALVNAQTRLEGSLEVRRGFERLNNGLIGIPHSLYFLKDANGRQWRYAITAERKLYVAPVTSPGDPAVWPLFAGNDFLPVDGGDNLRAAADSSVDPRALFTTYTLVGSQNKPYIFLADGEKFLKHSGGLAKARRVGIPKPTTALVVALKANDAQTIESFEDKTEWSVESGTTIADVTPGQTNDAVSLSVTGDKAVGGIYKALSSGGAPLNLDPFNDLEETFEIWVRFPTAQDALNCAEIVLCFGVSATNNDTTFKTRFEKAITPSDFEAATQLAPGGRTETYQDAETGALTTLSLFQSSNLIPGFGLNDPSIIDVAPTDMFNAADQFATGQSVQVRPGVNVWNRVRIRKSEFTRVGEAALTNPNIGWKTISALRIDIRNVDTAIGTPKSCVVQLDELCWQKTGKLFGTDYQWTYTYYDSRTDTESDFAPLAPIPYPGAQYGQYELTFPANPANTPPAADPDTIRLYRIGGTITQLQRLPISPPLTYAAATTHAPYTDNFADGLLLDPIEEDNQLPPDGVKGLVAHDNRLWTWGGKVSGVEEPKNRLRFSKVGRVEHFPTFSYVTVGAEGEEIVRCFDNDGELFIGTLTRVYRVVGSDGIYTVLPSGVNLGLRSPFGVARGLRSIFIHAYDGIYEFPSGRKVSEAVNPIFFGETVNGIQPVLAARAPLSSMAFWDNKLYFSYGSTDNPSIVNDRTIIWDTIYERWSYYLYGASMLFTEPENNILTAARVFQWDNIGPDGQPAGISDGGAWTLQLEKGFADHISSGYQGIFWAVDTKEYDLDLPDNEKRFIDFAFDADTQEEQMAVQVAFDSGEYEPLGTLLTSGREITVLPVEIGEGNGKLAYRVGLRFLSRTPASASGSARVFRVTHRILVEPPRHRTHVSDWSDYGTPGPKFFRELWLEAKTFGRPLEAIEIHIDDTVAHTINVGTTSSERTKFFYGLPPDLRGTLARIKVVTRGDDEVVVYDHGFQVIPEPPVINTIQSQWDPNGHQFESLWKAVQIDLDTLGKDIEFSFQLDGKEVERFILNADGRRRLYKSFEQDLLGKLGRLVVDNQTLEAPCCVLPSLRLYGTIFITEPMPPDTTLSDSFIQTMSFDKFKILHRIWATIKNPDADVMLSILVDNVIRDTIVVPQLELSSGYSKRRFPVKSGLKGKLFRFVWTSPFAFQYYPDKSEIQFRDLRTEESWRRDRLQPPMSY